MQQTETLKIEVVETGADAATSKVERLNAAMAKTGNSTKSLGIDLQGVVGNLKSLGNGGEAAMAGLDGLKHTAAQVGSNFGSVAAGAVSAALGIKTMSQRVNELNDATNAADASSKKLQATQAAYEALRASRGYSKGQQAPRGSDDARDFAAGRAAVSQAFFADKTAQAAKAAAVADLAFSQFLKTTALVAGGVAAAGLAIVGAFNGIGASARSAADDNSELADKLGLTMTQLEAMRLVANENSGSLEGLQRVFDKISKSMTKLDEDSEKARYAFEVLGLSQKDLANQSEQQIAGTIIKNYEALGRSAKATAAVAQLLGPGFRDQIPAIKAAADGLDGYTERAVKFGAVATKELVEKGGQQEVALSNLGLAWKGLANEIGLAMGDSVKSVAEGVTSFLDWSRRALAGRRESATPMATAIASRDEAKAEMEKYEKWFGTNRIGYYDAKKQYEAAIATINKLEADKAVEEYAKVENERFKRQAAASLKAMSDNAKPPRSEVKDPYEQALEQLRREATLRKDATAYEKTLFETQKGRFKDFDDSQKKVLLGLARQADAQDVLEKKAASQLKSVEEYEKAEERANEQLKQRIEYEDQLSKFTAKRLRDAGNSAQLDVAMLRSGTGRSSIDRQADSDIVKVIQDSQQAIEQLTPYMVDYEERVKEIRKAEAEATAAIRDAARQRKEYNADWTNGAKSAFASYLDDVTNVAGKTEALFSKAFGKAEDAIVDFVTTGKLNVKSLVASILQDIARYLIQVSIMAPIIAGLKSLMGFADGGVFEGGAMKTFAKGGAFSGGVQKFANGTVVNQPTLFPMTGGGLGVMGEAGPEAIMPLRRDGQGRLGVSATTTNSVQNTYAISIQVGSVRSDEDIQAIKKAMEDTIRAETKKTMANELRRGNMLNKSR